MHLYRQKGFTLLELSMVLLITTLFLTTTLAPLGSGGDGKRRARVTVELEQIREAMLGFVMINGYLPCPATETDPADDKYGIEADKCNNDSSTEGYLPWRTLGVKATDPWGLSRSAATDPFDGYWRYRVDRKFSDSMDMFDLDTDQEENIVIVNNDGNLLTSAEERPVAVIYSTGSNLTQDGENATYETKDCGNADGYDPNTSTCSDGDALYQSGSPTGVGTDAAYDDILIWISRPLLFNRMVTVGRLP
ncbi:MAG: type II secretion system protein [Gammaproteobacteria bacterium]